MKERICKERKEEHGERREVSRGGNVASIEDKCRWHRSFRFQPFLPHFTSSVQYKYIGFSQFLQFWREGNIYDDGCPESNCFYHLRGARWGTKRVKKNKKKLPDSEVGPAGPRPAKFRKM